MSLLAFMHSLIHSFISVFLLLSAATLTNTDAEYQRNNSAALSEKVIKDNTGEPQTDYSDSKSESNL